MMSVDYRVKKTLDLFNEMNDFIAKKGGATYTWDDCDKISLSEFLITLAFNVDKNECFNVNNKEKNEFVTIDCGDYKLMVSDGQGDSYQSDDKRVNFYETQNWVDKNCNEIKLGGYDDWAAPTKDELNLIYQNKNLFKGNDAFYDNNYWSSSEYSAPYAWRQYFNNGYQDYNNKTNFNYVRAVRRFTS